MTQNSTTRKLRFLGFVTLAAAVLTVVLTRWELLQTFENNLWDLRMKAIAREGTPDPRIRIITIDQASLDHFAQEEGIFWPWPRALYGAVIEYLTRAGAAGLALDMLFTEPSTVPEDLELAQAVSGKLPIIIAASLQTGTSSEDPDELVLFERRLATDNDQRAIAKRYFGNLNIPRYPAAAVPIPELVERATGLGNVSAAPDADGVYRSLLPGAYFKDLPILALPFATYEYAVQSKTKLLDLNEDYVIRYYGPALTYPTYPMAAIIQSLVQLDAGQTPIVDPKLFRNAFVLLGPSAPGLKDLRQIPLDDNFPGVELNATVLDNILNKSFIDRSSTTHTIVKSTALAVATTAIPLFLSSASAVVTALAAVVGAFCWFAYQAALAGVWMALAVPFAVAIIAFIGALAYQYQVEGRQHRFLRHAFRHYVSPEVISEIISDPSSLALGGERRELSIYFSDIEGFTSISERLEATALAELLNEYLSEMCDIIQGSGGTVDKYVGDAVVAFWNAPVLVPDHADRSVRAAIRCQERLAELRPAMKAKFGIEIRARIGIHTGEVSVGNFGSRDRFNYTMVGDAANLASRLEGANKFFGTSILISEDTYSRLNGEIPCRRVGSLLVVGRATAASVYVPLAGTSFDGNSDRLDAYCEGLAAFDRGDLTQAQNVFLRLPDDPVSIRYLKRLTELASTAPSAEWNPVWTLEGK